jgi:hypothetical protein
VASGEVADVERVEREARDLSLLPLRDEALGDAALIEHLDRARMQTAGAMSREQLGLAPLDDCYVHLRQRELARQHQAGRTATGDHHLVLGFVGLFRHSLKLARAAVVFKTPATPA